MFKPENEGEEEKMSKIAMRVLFLGTLCGVYGYASTGQTVKPMELDKCCPVNDPKGCVNCSGCSCDLNQCTCPGVVK
jgi:hypothetical protein